MTRPDYILQRAESAFNMLILRGNKASGPEAPALVKMNLAQEAFTYAEIFVKEAEQRGLEFTNE